jgi:AP-2 complex subunit sigma-1
MLEYIHLFVEILDKYFGSVCELDIVYNFYKVYNILDDLIVAGETIEASRELIVKKQRELEFYD